MSTLERAAFGNQGGSHQLLNSSIPAGSPVLDRLRFLVDRPAGNIDAGVVWSPYWGCQRLEDWWVLWRGQEDLGAPRKNMVTAQVVLLPVDQCGELSELDAALAAVGWEGSERVSEEFLGLVGAVVDRLSRGEAPAILPNISLAPILLRSIWPRLWASARSSLSLRTVFGIESLESSSYPSIVVFPAELKSRWRGQPILDGTAVSGGPVARWFSGVASPQLERLLGSNAAHLPGDFTVLGRVERIVGRLERLLTGVGTPDDALVVVRTQEAFTDGLTLSPEDLQVVRAGLIKLSDASSGEVRAASLARMAGVPELSEVEAALSQWVEVHLPDQPTDDALWILENHTNKSYPRWWRRAIGQGLDTVFLRRSSAWATAVWRWWQVQPRSISWTSMHLDTSHKTEEWLATNIPTNASDGLLEHVISLCREREWATLLARALGSVRALSDCVKVMQRNLRTPEAGLNALLDERSEAEVVDAAAVESWLPLTAKAVAITLAKPRLLARALRMPGLVPLLTRHLAEGGAYPTELVREGFLTDVFDGALAGNEDFQKIAQHLGGEAGLFVLDHPYCDRLLPLVGSEVANGAVEEWWKRFLADDSVGRPPSVMCSDVLNSAHSRIADSSITFVISVLQLFPEISQATFAGWMRHTGCHWAAGDHQRLAALLIERRWKLAANEFRWSWKRELTIVAWYARQLLSWSNGFWSRPDGVDQMESIISNTRLKGETTTAIDVGIITVKEEEYEALLDKFSPAEPLEGKNRDYDVASIATNRGVCRVAITRCVQQGNAHAQNTATELLGDLNPGFVLVVGIAGGVPTPDFCLGDVVISDYLQDLTLEDTGTGQSSRRHNALGGPLHSSATRIVERLRAVERANSWNDAEAVAFPRPGLEGAHTTDDAEWNTDISAALERHSNRRAPIATARKIASSDRLIKDPELLKMWRTVLKAVSAVEMESAGVYIPCQRNNIPVLAIRGISDIVGWERDEHWTLYACHTAAAYTRMLVGAGVFCARART